MPSRILRLTALLPLAALATASPIGESLETPAELKAAGVTLQAKRRDDPKPSIDFLVTWMPDAKERDADSPPRMDLILKPLDGNDAFHSKLQLRYDINSEGKCHADFTIAESELATATLWFRLSQQTEYRLLLTDYTKATATATAPPVKPAEPIPHSEIVRVMTPHIVKELRAASIIVIADSKEPQGTTITQVIRGDETQFKALQQRNESTFPLGPLLIYQETNDIGGHSVSSLAYQVLDETKRFIIIEAFTGKTEKILIPLEDILKQLKAP